jgi:putative endonuclease
MRRGYVYLMASKRNGTLYLGVTSDLPRRVWEHQTNHDPTCFTAVNKVYNLVWFEDYDLITEAIQREKTMKGWPREWKITLIEKANPKWYPLHPETSEFQIG